VWRTHFCVPRQALLPTLGAFAEETGVERSLDTLESVRHTG
jgi:hypothetical protein